MPRHNVMRMMVLFLALFWAQRAGAVECEWAMAPLGDVAGAPEVATATCKSAAGPLKVRKLRLNEPLAAALLLNEMPPEVKDYFGSYVIVENELSKGTADLFKRFGRREVFEAKNVAFSLNVKGVEGSGGWRSLEVRGTGVGTNRAITQINGTFEWSRDENILAPKTELSFDKRSDFPPSCKMIYTCLSDAVNCTNLWRYLSANELAERLRETEEALVRENKERGGDQPPDFTELRRKFAYLNVLAKRGWPGDFMVMAQSVPECGAKFYAFHPRPISLDIMVFENGAETPIAIGDLLGNADASDRLRSPPPPSNDLQPLKIAFTLEPGKAVIVPVRSTHHSAAIVAEMADQAEIAREMYRRIVSKPANALFQYGTPSQSSKERDKKVRSAFKPPEFPSARDYILGPDMQISGFVVQANEGTIGGKDKQYDVVLLSALANKQSSEEKDVEEREWRAKRVAEQRATPLKLWNPANAEVSCPILRIYDDASGEWVKRGKVLHAARGREQEMQEFIEVPISARRFSLMEEEAEMAVIRDVTLVLTFDDGHSVRLAPKTTMRSPLIVRAFEKADFEFAVPGNVDVARIVRSRLALTGHYIRYDAVEQASLSRR